MKPALIAMLTVVLVVLAACGDDDDESLPDTGSPTPTAPTTPTNTQQPSTATASATPTQIPTPSPTLEPLPTALTEEMIDAISTYVTANDFLGARREMTDPPSCDDAVGGGLQFLGKVCVLPSTFAPEGTDVVVRAGIWSSDGVVDMVLRQEGGVWTVVEVREPQGGEL